MKENPQNPKGVTRPRIIVSAEFLGPSYQYSRGLSIYFPWTRPVGDRRIMSEYEGYKFHQEFADCKHKSWLDFLELYFKETQRFPSIQEPDELRYVPDLRETRTDLQSGKAAPARCQHTPRCPPLPEPPKPFDPCAPPQDPPTTPPGPPSPCQKELEERELREDIANLIYGEGPLLGDYELAGDKTGPRDPTGGNDCACPSIKNYPQDTRPRRERAEKAIDSPRVEVTQADFL